MRAISIFSALVFFAACGAAAAQAPAARPEPLTFTNPPFADGGVIPDKYTAKTATPPAVSPALSWTHVPAGTASYALIMHDLDVVIAKSATDNLHWLAFNIPGTATSLPQGVPPLAQLPDGTIQPMNRTANGYRGPGAPPGLYHHYAIELYAVDTKLSLGATATRNDVIAALKGHVLGKAVMVGRFHR